MNPLHAAYERNRKERQEAFKQTDKILKSMKTKNSVTPPPLAPKMPGRQKLDRQIRKAVEADFQQYFVDAMTPDRGYSTPIDNVRKLIVEPLAIRRSPAGRKG